MREIDTGALQDVSRMLGISNPASVTQQAVFDDEILQQVLEVTPAIRRGAGLPQGTLWSFSIENVHAGAGTVTGDASPYFFTDTLYPNSIELDIYFVSAFARRVGAGAGAFTGGALFVDYPTKTWLTGSKAAGTVDLGWAERITGQVTPYTGASPWAVWGGGSESTIFPGIRLPTPTKLTFVSELDAAGTARLVVTMGIFPARTGSDVRG